jgi:hypothetical protein
VLAHAPLNHSEYFTICMPEGKIFFFSDKMQIFSGFFLFSLLKMANLQSWLMDFLIFWVKKGQIIFLCG